MNCPQQVWASSASHVVENMSICLHQKCISWQYKPCWADQLAGQVDNNDNAHRQLPPRGRAGEGGEGVGPGLSNRVADSALREQGAC